MIETFAFTDIVGSTDTKQRLGDAAYFAILEEHHARIRQFASDSELNTAGDSFLLHFPDPVEAISIAVKIQKSLAEQPIDAGGEPLAIRIGMDLGNPRPMLHPHGRADFSGKTLDQAARIEGLADGGQILISEKVHLLAKTEVRDLLFHDWGLWLLKGVHGATRIFEVLRDGQQPRKPLGRAHIPAPRRFSGPFVGREEDIRKIRDLMGPGNQRLITLRGEGGIGKTRLADEISYGAAGDFADGVEWVNLESTPNSATAVEGEIRSQCHIEAGSLTEHFANRQTLLVLNNFENVREAKGVVRNLHDTCSGLSILITSRVLLRVYGEQEYAVDPLDRDSAEQLFLNHAKLKNHSFAIAPADAEQFAKILDLTDRIPYCLELAAARCGQGRPLNMIAEGLEKKFLSLEAEEGEMASDRHRNVVACLDWSVDLLDGAERELLPKLSVFRGGFFAEDAHAICGSSDIERPLESLSDASLLRRSVAAEKERYSLPPTAAEYAGRLLGESEGELRKRHSQRYLEVATDVATAIDGREQRGGYSRLRIEFENLRSGMAWAEEQGDDQTVVSYANAFANRLHTIQRAAEQVEICGIVLGAANRVGDQEQIANAQIDLGIAYKNLPTGDRGENVRRAIACFEAALRFSTERGFPGQWAAAQNNLGTSYNELPTGDRGENQLRAIACFEAALRVYTERDLPLAWSKTQNNLGNAYGAMPTGDRAENLRHAIDCYEAALRVYTELNSPVNWAATENNLGAAYRALPTGDRGETLRRAIACFEAALRVYTERDFPVNWAATQNNLGTAYQHLPTGGHGENPRRAIACFEAALRVYTERDFTMAWAMTQQNLASIHEMLGLPQGAVAHCEAAIRGFHAAGLHRDAEELESHMARLTRSTQSGPG